MYLACCALYLTTVPKIQSCAGAPRCAYSVNGESKRYQQRYALSGWVSSVAASGTCGRQQTFAPSGMM